MHRKAVPILLVIVILLIWPILPTQAKVYLDEVTPTETSGIIGLPSDVWAPTITASPIPSRRVTVTAPNGGELLYVGDTYRITWDSSPNIDKVTIGYKSCPSCLSWIAYNIPNTGYYDWIVYVGNTINTEFTIQITGYQTGIGSVTDTSDTNFTVLKPPTSTASAIPTSAVTTTAMPPTQTKTFTPTSTAVVTSTPRPTITATSTPAHRLEVTSPNGGELLYVGHTYRLIWDSSPNIDKVSIGYKSCPSCLSWIAYNIPNTGYHDWTVYVGNTVNTEFLIHIIGYETGVGSVTDTSDATFTVLNPPTPTATATVTATATSTPITQLKMPVLLYPINGSVISATRPVFDWKDVSGAKSYTIQVSTSSNFSTLLINTTRTASYFLSSKTLPRQVMLYWRVRANGSTNSSNWALTSFKIR
jgi:hypothetical protein